MFDHSYKTSSFNDFVPGVWAFGYQLQKKELVQALPNSIYHYCFYLNVLKAVHYPNLKQM